MIVLEEKKTYYFDSSNHQAAFLFSRELSDMIRQKKRIEEDPVILCIGSDRATGDSLGPLIGHKLASSHSFHNSVYGTLEQPVHAKNLEDTLVKIKKAHKRAFIIAIDASLGTQEHIGYISLKADALKPGAGVSKILPSVGKISITGIVNASVIASAASSQLLLQTTRLHLVMQLADCISLGLRYTFPSSL